MAEKDFTDEVLASKYLNACILDWGAKPTLRIRGVDHKPAKIINGRRYDTERAKEIGYYESDFERSNFQWYEETLYQKKTGEFFIYGNGHAASPYSTSYGYTSRGPGDALVPLTLEEAQKWVEEHLSVETYEELFGEADEDDETVAVCIKLTPKTRDMAKRIASERGTTMSALIESLITGIM